MNRVRLFAWIGVAGAIWGLVFAAISTLDYASHLDRGLHDLHCSFIPGVEAGTGGEGCRTALNSPYAALLKDSLWGGVPISLFGLGCFCFLLGHALFMTAVSERASRAEGLLYGLLAISPALVSAVMFSISWFELGTICKTCAGIYMASLALAVSGAGVIRGTSGRAPAASDRSWRVAPLVLGAMLACVLLPSVVYAAFAPDHAALVMQCGEIKNPKESHGALLSLPGANAKKSALFFEDPLCPTCKSLHDRLSSAGVLDRLNVDLALFPLDSECNWMLQQPLHPGACTLSKAILCAKSPMQMLDWAYENQEELAEAGRAGEKALTQMVSQRFGADVARCMRDRATQQRLNRHLHFAVGNGIPISTPQVFIENQRLCDEDIDMGLMFALRHLAPEIAP